ncbi:MAG: protein kinase, partial [Planctomycetes bacterium]|nr:protein kinase [Planctomycetota bacterium]
MTSEQTCPNNDHLKALLDDTLPAEEQSTLEKHLETCSECRLRFERLASGGTSPNGEARLAEALDSPDTALEELKAKLKTEPQSETTIGESPGDAAVSLDFLAPSENPQSLGRLGIYDIRGVIGSGGMGVVLKGHDPRLDRIVAIKVLSPQLASNATARKRFLREAQKAAAVAHEHVVAIHAVDEQDHLPYIVMEYIVGVSLDERIKRSGSLKTEEILRIGMQTASGLAAAHAQGLVHRDVKPSNILLENGVERVKLADFGLARAIDDTEITGAGVVVGTPQYMSPEQARGEPVDHRSDLFGLGCVMYAMCTGRSPFRAATVVDAIRRVCDDTPRRIHKVNPDIPDWLVEIIDRLLAKQPDDRFQSASEVAELLGGHLAHLQRPAVVAQPARLSRVAEASRHSPSRRSWPMWGAALVTVLIVAGVGTHFGGWFRPSPSPEPVASGTDSGQGDVAPPPPGDHALQFDGDDFVALRSISYNGSHPITLEAIIQPELSYPAQVPKVTEAGATTIVGNISGNGGIGLAATPCGIKMAVCGGEAYRNTTAIKTPFPKAAVHVAGVFDPEEQLFTLFVDGQRKAERPFCWSFKPSLTAFVIGAAAPHWKLHGKACPETSLDVFGGFRGTMDEVRISNTTRYTEDFIPEPRLEPDVTTIALYHFDEGTGTIAKDNSGNRNDGIIIGAKWVATEGYTPRPSYASPKP